MKQRILNHVGIMVVLSVILTFIAASAVMYGKYNHYMKQDVRNEAEYIRYAVENTGKEYLNKTTGDLTTSRITLAKPDGTILYDSEKDASDLENHKDRPEIIEAMKEGTGEVVRFSQTLSKQTFYYAVKLNGGNILRVAKTTDSVLSTMLSSFTLLGLLLIAILALAFFVVEKQTRRLIAPINELDLEHPLEHVAYEELRPLLNRVDEQNVQIAKQVEELKQAEMVRREFSANVSHELKTPLMSISGYAEIMRDGLVQPQDVPEFAGRIYDEASRLTSLVQDIIEISKLDESKNMPFEDVDLYEMTQDICQTLMLPAKKKRVTVLMEGKSVSIQGVRHVLYEMLYNLVDNAIKYNKEGGYVKVLLAREKDGVRWSVEDNGIGIAKEEQERIFERFYRVDKSHSRKTGGTGLGLSIVKHGAALHHAKIVLNSEPGKGTKIVLRF
ncbi:MAG: ATP-binding protein [Blautia sp.]|jgi:two-component system phosphate regulon sensor histidine kinase PhoR|uniref:sensor histidine kinase n=1 Tax=unclassified Blautia TaxID=2648079 RepID=UPI001FD5EE55|nr:ATP-binding protein [Blautia sp. NSJ-175]MCJ7844335.1 ATP-binding protein [Blautia sp. NSJ-175]